MIEVVVAAIAAAGVVLAAILPVWRRNGRKLTAIDDQVTNAHGTYLRDDLDFIRDVLLDVLKRVEHLEKKGTTWYLPRK